MQPKFSVVIPVYNGQAFIRQALECVFRQDYPAHQVIVVDDGSTDDTPKILESYRGRILAVRQANAGASKARNTALAHVTGDHVAFLDADDIWLRSKLARFAKAFEGHPEVGAVFGNYVVRVDIFGNRLVRHYSGLRTRERLNFDAPLRMDPFEALLVENFTGTPSAAALKKSVIDQVGLFSNDHRPSEDYEYWLRCSAVTRFMLLSEITMYKRTHGANLSLDRIRIGRSHRKVLIDAPTACRSAFESRPRLRRVWTHALAHENYRLGDLAFTAGRFPEALEYYREGLASCPTAANGLRYGWIVAKKTIRRGLNGLRGPGIRLIVRQRDPR